MTLGRIRKNAKGGSQSRLQSAINERRIVGEVRSNRSE